ncbi:MAG: V-type ATP synthase subunit E [Spirochaetaceae bacterium]|jgi:V/A-type H+-transporting ATPase subunit E|nr:V-type ATP synthase subunit E [Spirochaetaceae bacterium]
MEIQLQELIDKIKRDGIESASQEAARLKTQAEDEARRIVDAARREAESIVSQAKTDAERAEKAGIAAVGQAARNVVLSFRTEIQAILDRIVARETTAALSGDLLASVLPDILRGWSGGDELSLILPEPALGKITAYFNEKIAGELTRGIELKSDRNLAAGFRIANRDGSAYYDFSAESVAELLSAYLNPRLAETLKESVKGI